MSIKLHISNIFSKSFDDIIHELNIYLKNITIQDDNYKRIIKKGYKILLQTKDIDIENIKLMLITLFSNDIIYIDQQNNYIPLKKSIIETNYLGSDNDFNNHLNNDSNNNISKKKEIQKEILSKKIKNATLVKNPFDISSRKHIWNEVFNFIFLLINSKIN